jgi:hypothetical protein
LARVQALRVADQDGYRKAMAEQAIVHFRENALVPQQFDIYRESLRAAVRLIDHFVLNQCHVCRKLYKTMTPADLKRLEEIRAVASGEVKP